MQPVWVPELQEYWPVEKPCDWTLETSGHDNWFWGGIYFKCTDFQFSFQVVCFGENCKYSPKDDNMYERLSNLGMHFIEVHSFKQDAYRWNIDCLGQTKFEPWIRKCNICNLEFAEERKYNSHMRKHDESFQCELCKRKITGRLWYVRFLQREKNIIWHFLGSI